MFTHNMQKMNKMIEAPRYAEREDYMQSKAKESTYKIKKFIVVKSVKGIFIS